MQLSLADQAWRVYGSALHAVCVGTRTVDLWIGRPGWMEPIRLALAERSLRQGERWIARMTAILERSTPRAPFLGNED